MDVPTENIDREWMSPQGHHWQGSIARMTGSVTGPKGLPAAGTTGRSARADTLDPPTEDTMTTTRTSGPRRAARPLAMMAAVVAALAGCAGEQDGGAPQVIEGRVAPALGSDVKGVRAVVDGRTVASSRVRGDGHFALSVPVARGVRLEVVTERGTRGFVGTT